MTTLPPPLRRGDAVAVISPSGPVLSERVEGAVRCLRQWGFEPVLGKHCLGSCEQWGTIRLAAPDDDRLADLEWALYGDSRIKAVMCSRGGYGMARLLDRLDYKAIAAHPKWVWGFSDISALHAALHHAGVASLHAPMAKHLAQQGIDNDVSRAIYSAITGVGLPSWHVAPHWLNRAGTAQATLLGGNLAVLSGLLSTPYNIIQPGTILFIEDVAEEVYRVERMLCQLRLNGTLARLAGLVVGQFTGYRDGSPSHTAMYDMISAIVRPYGYPVAFNFPVGHVDYNVPLVEGATARLTVGDGGATLSFSLANDACAPA